MSRARSPSENCAHPDDPLSPQAVADAVTAPQGGDRERDGELGLPNTGAPEEDHVLSAPNEAQDVEIVDLLTRRATRVLSALSHACPSRISPRLFARAVFDLLFTPQV